MKNFYALLILFLIVSCKPSAVDNTSQSLGSESNTNEAAVPYAMVIHGGAGTILKKNMTDEKEKTYVDALNTALNIGEKILKDGGSSIDAVEATIRYMEDQPMFNAGKGAVFTNAGRNEHDSSIMYGKDQNAGASGGTSIIKHPISLARAVMEKSDHVMLSGQGAEEFAKLQNLEIVDPQYFYTESRWNSLQRILKKEAEEEELALSKRGTVGCVALDREGNICAGTSTGGMTNKRYSRIGDSPIIGAGTYADNATCGVSCTGHGEYFIRYAVAHDVSARMAYLGESVANAANTVVNTTLVNKGGSGGLIALDRKGNIAMPFNTEGMYRGYIKPGERVVKIYKD